MRKISALFALAMIFVLLLPSVSAFALTVSPAGEFPIVDEEITLTIATYGDSLEDRNERFFTKYISDLTGVKFEWIVVPDSDFKTKINLLFASNGQVDIIASSNNPGTMWTKSEELKYANQELVIPLNDLIEKYGTYTKKVFDSIDGLRDYVTMPDGNIYGLPAYNAAYHTIYMQKMWINQVWLDNLGLDLPRTTEEFVEVLRAFRDLDANGNGDPNDEIPFSAVASSDGFFALDGFLMNSFVYTDTYNQRLYLDNGTVTAAYTQDEYKEGLKWLNELWEEGLIAPESYTQDSATLTSYVNADTNIVGCFPCGHVGIHASTGAREDGSPARYTEYTALYPLEGPNGVQWGSYFPYRPVRPAATMITSSCEYPEVAFRVLDLLYDVETLDGMGYLAVKGERGVAWDSADPDGVSLAGEPALWKTMDVPEDLGNSAMGWGEIFNYVLTSDFRLAQQAVGTSGLYELYLKEQTDKYAQYAVPFEMCMPMMYFDEAVASDIAQMQTAISTYTREKVMEYITGMTDIESDWANYLAELDHIGFQEYIKLHQDTYDMTYGD